MSSVPFQVEMHGPFCKPDLGREKENLARKARKRFCFNGYRGVMSLSQSSFPVDIWMMVSMKTQTFSKTNNLLLML